ncbi:hypothetical protein T484DRAFT_1920047, partial [Baffinella frigidus]
SPSPRCGNDRSPCLWSCSCSQPSSAPLPPSTRCTGSRTCTTRSRRRSRQPSRPSLLSPRCSPWWKPRTTRTSSEASTCSSSSPSSSSAAPAPPPPNPRNA